LKFTTEEGEAMIQDATAIMEIPMTALAPQSEVNSAHFYSSVFGGLSIKSLELKSSPPELGWFVPIPNPRPLKPPAPDGIGP